MIRTLADLLFAFAEEESRKLDEFELDHAPTIGAMYEGLSATVVSRAIPDGLNLQVVSGHVVGHDGSMSPQIDCMVVRGDGESIPYTSDWKWPVEDVLAIFEVKKALYGNELRDAFVHSQSVYEMAKTWLHREQFDKPVSINRALRSFSRITGMHAPEFAKYHESLPQELALIYYTLVVEQLVPLRLILGYGGYKTEAGL